MKIIFMGTPEFAAASLQALVESGRYEIPAVVTQPDRPKGRGHKLMQSAVKTYALAQGLPVLQPERVKDDAFFAQMEAYAPDLIVVAAFGQFLPERLLQLPRYGCINVHASLRRGPNPLCHPERRKRGGRHHHADGCRHGYGCHAAEGEYAHHA